MWSWRPIPDGNLNRIRLAAMAVGGLALFSQLTQLGNELRSPQYERLSAYSILLIFGILLHTYVRGRAGWWTIVPVPVLVTVGAAGLMDPLAGTALAMAATLVLSFYGSGRMWTARIVGDVAAIPAALVISPHSVDREMLWNSPMVLAVLPQVLLMGVMARGIYLVLVRQERTSAREALVARAGQKMLGVTDIGQIREVGRQTAEGLVALCPGVALLILRRTPDGLRVANLAGAPAELLGQAVDQHMITEPARPATLPPGFPSWHVDPLGADLATAELYMVVAGRRPVPADVVDSFRTLLHQVMLGENGCLAHAELEHTAHHDHLTQLPNRAKFLRAVVDAVTHQPAGTVALVNVDLDDFKRVNDVYGHAAGDELLVEVAARLAGVAAERGVAGRFGGDEFALLLTGLSGAEEANETAALLCARLAEPIRLSVATATVGASIGVAVTEPGISIAELTRRADLAMYSAKSGGKNRTETFPSAVPPQLAA